MPAKSKAQLRFMEAVARGYVKQKGLSRAKAKEFTKGVDPEKLPEKIASTKVKSLEDARKLAAARKKEREAARKKEQEKK